MCHIPSTCTNLLFHAGMLRIVRHKKQGDVVYFHWKNGLTYELTHLMNLIITLPMTFLLQPKKLLTPKHVQPKTV